MGLIYHEKTVTVNIGSANVVASTLYSFVSAYTDKLSYESGTNILTFNNRFSLRVAALSGRGRPYLIRGDGTEVDLGDCGYWTASDKLTMKLKILEDVFILSVIRTDYPNDGYSTLSWIESDERDFFVKVNTKTMSIDIGTYYDARSSDPNQNYTLRNMFGFAVNPQKLLFADQAYIANSDKILIPISGLYSCSTLTRDIIITMNGQNYYAIGANFIGLVQND